MKKILLLLILALPTLAYAQAPTDSSSDEFPTVLIWLFVLIVVFIICRELICWYYKINKMVSNQDEIIRLFKKIANEHEAPSNNTML